MDMKDYYRCPICSTRECAVVVRIQGKDAHIKMHEDEEKEEVANELSG